MSEDSTPKQVPWRGVPMPPSVAALPRTARGIPISYTVCWSSEVGKPRVKPDPLLAALCGHPREAIFWPGRRGYGQPLLRTGHEARQREGVIGGLCQVCAGKLPGADLRLWRPQPRPADPPWRFPSPRWIADLRNARGLEAQVEADGPWLPVLTDGWTCEQCLGYSLLTCPALLGETGRAETGEELRLFRVRSAKLVPIVGRPAELTEEELPNGAVGLVEVVPTDYDVVTPLEFLNLGQGSWSGSYPEVSRCPVDKAA